MTNRSSRLFTRLLAAIALLMAAPLLAQAATERPPVVTGAPKVRVENVTVHSRAIAGNLLGTSPDREVVVVLPPSYDSQPDRLYPVVYLMHGFTGNPERWFGQLHMPDTAQAAFAGGTPEMILVFPNGDNVFGGAFYSNSPTAGNFEDFIADELVAYVDSHFRSIPRRESRGLGGHSMGGYGAARIGMRRAERFGAIYLMSPCCLEPLGTQGMTAADVGAVAAMKGPADAIGAKFSIQGPLATAAAWSPNPRKPPMFVDLAIDDEGVPRPDIMAKRAANAPAAFLDQYVSQLRSFRGIGMDVGDQDSIVPALTRLHDALDGYGIANEFEVYPGTHTSRVAFRFEDRVLPFFGRTLSSTP